MREVEREKFRIHSAGERTPMYQNRTDSPATEAFAFRPPWDKGMINLTIAT